MTNQNQLAVKPGEIRLDYLWVHHASVDWPLTPLGNNKDPYVPGWQNKPFGISEIEEEIANGSCKAVGLIGGPVFNLPYGLVWVDVDGPTVYGLIEEISGFSFDKALPKTLTIKSGKEGRERKLYKLNRDKHKHFARNKYTWHAEGDKEKLEILWKRHQGVLMGLHPETDGYFTAEDQGFEWVDQLPELPDWLLNVIINKNVKQGIPSTETTRIVGPTFVVQSKVDLERDMKLAEEATWALPPEAADDYDIWITVGQSLHSLDEAMLDVWEEWSKQSEKYREGECQRRWRSFSRGGGRGMGSLIHIAQENGWRPSQEYRALNVDDATLERAAEQQAQLDAEMEMSLARSLEPVGQTAEKIWTKQQKQVGWSQQKQKEEKEGSEVRAVSSDVVADTLLGMYKGNLVYSIRHGQFFMYETEARGLWTPLTKVEILGDIRAKLTMLRGGLIKGFTTKLINDVHDQLQSSLHFKDWYEGNQFLLFTNGVLDVETRELLPFKRELYLTQQMPYPYDPAATCEDIVKWLKHVQRDSWSRTQVLRAWLRATLLGRYEMQKFVEIVGPGKSGKSTYANLAVALVGKKNVYSTDFDNLEKNRFEAAGYMGKKLLLFQDADRWGGSVSRLKAITGNDWIRSERKYQNENQEPFQFKGVVIITANEAIQSTDYTSGLARRRLTIPFDRPFTGGPNEQKELIKFNSRGEPQGEFAPLLPGLVNWLLDMSEEEMRSYLMETEKRVAFFEKYTKLQNLRSNPLLDWLDHKIVYEPNNRTVIGFAKYETNGSSSVYAKTSQWLYASYAQFCRDCNVGIMSRSRFEPLLLDICANQLGLNVISKRNSKGLQVFNIAIRSSDQRFEHYPSIVDVATNKEKYKELYGTTLIAKDGVIMENDSQEVDE